MTYFGRFVKRMLCEVSLSLTEKVSYREELETIDKVRKRVHLREREGSKSNEGEGGMGYKERGRGKRRPFRSGVNI